MYQFHVSISYFYYHHDSFANFWGDGCDSHSPNIVIAWLTLLLRIREVLGSNLDPETGYPDTFSWFSKSLPENAGIVP
jgi:hypothetical protein